MRHRLWLLVSTVSFLVVGCSSVPVLEHDPHLEGMDTVGLSTDRALQAPEGERSSLELAYELQRRQVERPVVEADDHQGSAELRLDGNGLPVLVVSENASRLFPRVIESSQSLGWKIVSADAPALEISLHIGELIDDSSNFLVRLLRGNEARVLLTLAPAAGGSLIYLERQNEEGLGEFHAQLLEHLADQLNQE